MYNEPNLHIKETEQILVIWQLLKRWQMTQMMNRKWGCILAMLWSVEMNLCRCHHPLSIWVMLFALFRFLGHEIITIFPQLAILSIVHFDPKSKALSKKLLSLLILCSPHQICIRWSCLATAMKCKHNYFAFTTVCTDKDMHGDVCVYWKSLLNSAINGNLLCSSWDIIWVWAS